MNMLDNDIHDVRGEMRRVDDSAVWLMGLRRYFIVSASAHLIWEFAHMPLYTIWRDGTPGDIAFAAIHCTGGDLLIASSSLMLAILIGGKDWPKDGIAFRRVAALTILAGLGYTIFSEWLNIVIRKAWAYSDLMPVIPLIDTGLSPVLQWIVIPLTAFWWIRSGIEDEYRHQQSVSIGP